MKNLRYVSAALLVVVLAACDGNSRPFEEAVETRELNLTALTVNVPAISVPQLVMNFGETADFSIEGTSATNQTVDVSSNDRTWSVSDESVATISNDGRLTAVADGAVDVFVTIAGLRSNNYPVVVSNQPLRSISTIFIENDDNAIVERCLPENFRATGVFGDGSTRDLRNVNWTLAGVDSNNARVVDKDDLSVTFTALNEGSFELMANMTGVAPLTRTIVVANTLQSITISPSSGDVDVDETIDFAAIGSYTGSAPGVESGTRNSEVITQSVDWSILTGGDKASVTNDENSRGVVKGRNAGTAVLQASCGAELVTANITVGANNNNDSLAFERGDRVVLSLNQAPILLRVSLGSSFNSDELVDNDDLNWTFSSENNTTNVINLNTTGTNAGTISPIEVGTGVITVSDDDGRDGQITVQVVN